MTIPTTCEWRPVLAGRLDSDLASSEIGRARARGEECTTQTRAIAGCRFAYPRGYCREIAPRCAFVPSLGGAGVFSVIGPTGADASLVERGAIAP